MALGDISGSHLDLLERQLLILQRAIAPSDETRRRGFCLSSSQSGRSVRHHFQMRHPLIALR
ncbi:MAG: hypothetical protein CM15mP103_00690 [Gammaproteobacteria bacterium]|nr:MAG: hypothetical protein CM15mP103_00690 [Gammaproteobacteria bacterium]